jgi:hypothetical protein
MTTLAQQEQAAIQAAAQADLAILQTFFALVTNGATTVAQVNAAITALPASINDPARAAVCTEFAADLAGCYGNVETLISQTNAAAGN